MQSSWIFFSIKESESSHFCPFSTQVFKSHFNILSVLQYGMNSENVKDNENSNNDNSINSKIDTVNNDYSDENNHD